MADLSLFMSGLNGTLRYQDFTSSGTFTPSSKLAANGGACFVMLIGGGGGGATNNGGSQYPGKHGQYKFQHTKITSPVTVTIGSGGAAGQTTPSLGSVGGTTTVGSLTANGGLGGNLSSGGPQTTDQLDSYFPPTVGRGGGVASPGNSGFVRIIWSE